MSYILHTVQKDKEQLSRMLAIYQKQLENLPKGSVTEKIVGNNVYYYLKHRDGKKVLTEYLGKDGPVLEQTLSALDKRRHIEAMIAHLKKEVALADKILGVKDDCLSWQ